MIKRINGRKVSDSENVNFKVNVNEPIHVFTSSEGVIIRVFDECVKGVRSCDYKLQGEKLQLSSADLQILFPWVLQNVKRPMNPWYLISQMGLK